MRYNWISLLALSALALTTRTPFVFADDGAWKQLNGAFLSAYQQGKQSVIHRSRPVLIVSDDRMTLVTQKKTQSWNLDMRTFHDLKTMSHVPLTFFLICHEFVEPGVVPSVQIRKLREFKSLLQKGRGELARFPEANRARQARVLDRALQVVDQTVFKKRIGIAELNTYVQEQTPDIQKNIEEAVAHQIGVLRSKMEIIKAILSQSEFSQLKIVISGPSQPRERNLFLQFFEDDLKIKGDRAKLLYAENTTSNQQAIDQLAAVLLDREMSTAFFQGDPRALERDIRGQATEQYLKERK